MEIIQTSELFRRDRFVVGHFYHIIKRFRRNRMGCDHVADIYDVNYTIPFGDAFTREIIR